jgi:hypothetical protein
MLLSEYYGADGHENRRSEILVDGNNFLVKMYKNEVLVKSQMITEHTLQYAEDCAENWTLGVIKE